jgi:anti-sigma regulatory factor (Ser/Thr protein kinase)
MGASHKLDDPARSTVAIARFEDAAVARSVVRRFALRWGFCDKSANEIALGASELATNLVKHAGGGELQIEHGERGVTVRSLDRGPGPPPIEQLVADNVSRGVTRGPDTPVRLGLGSGGAALARLFDEVEVARREGGGAVIQCTRMRDRVAQKDRGR